ncbi:membrane protein [Microbacterium sediminicola]|uniref:Membrane protein n=1 Tax=Microbacterium sediminicola TaxID=415210 RepID=A0ABN2I0Z7_9MICO
MISSSRPRMTGIGRVLVIVYAIMALASTGRSFVQIVREFDAAPVAYTLSALAAVVYILATLALIFSRSQGWYVVAWIAIVFELAGVLIVGTLSWIVPAMFGHPSVWSYYGGIGPDGYIGYLFVPLILPFLGLWWLWTHRARVPAAAAEVAAS